MGKINRKNIEFYLNSMYVSETEYMLLYNHFSLHLQNRRRVPF